MKLKDKKNSKVIQHINNIPAELMQQLIAQQSIFNTMGNDLLLIEKEVNNEIKSIDNSSYDVIFYDEKVKVYNQLRTAIDSIATEYKKEYSDLNQSNINQLNNLVVKLQQNVKNHQEKIQKKISDYQGYIVSAKHRQTFINLDIELTPESGLPNNLSFEQKKEIIKAIGSSDPQLMFYLSNNKTMDSISAELMQILKSQQEGWFGWSNTMSNDLSLMQSNIEKEISHITNFSDFNAYDDKIAVYNQFQTVIDSIATEYKREYPTLSQTNIKRLDKLTEKLHQSLIKHQENLEKKISDYQGYIVDAKHRQAIVNLGINLTPEGGLPNNLSFGQKGQVVKIIDSTDPALMFFLSNDRIIDNVSAELMQALKNQNGWFNTMSSDLSLIEQTIKKEISQINDFSALMLMTTRLQYMNNFK